MSETADDRLAQAVSLGKQLVTQNQELIETRNQLLSQVEKLKSELSSIESQFEIMSMKNIELQSVNSSNNDEIRLLTQSLNQSKSSMDKLSKEYESLKMKYRQTQYLERGMFELTSKLEDRAQRISELEDLLIKRNDQLLDLTAVHEQTLERVKTLTQIDSEYQESRKQISELIVQNKELSFLIEKYKREHHQLHEQITKIQETNTKLGVQNEIYRNDNARLLVEINSFDKQKLFHLTAERDDLLKTLNEKTEMLTQLQIKLDSLKEKYQSTEEKWYERHDELESAIKHYNDLHTQDKQCIDSLSSEIERLTKLIEIGKLDSETTFIDMKSQLNKDNQLIDEYELQIKQCKNQLKIKQNEIDVLSDKLSQVQEFNETMIVKLKKDQDSYVDQLVTEHQMVVIKLKQIHEHELNIIKNENNILTRDIEQLQQQHRAAIDSIKLETTETVQNYENQLQLLRQQLTHKDTIISETRKELEIYETERHEQKVLQTKLYNDLYSDMNKQINDLQAELKMWKDKLNTDEGEEDKDQKIKKLTIELSRLQTERDLLASKPSQSYSNSEDSTSETITRSRSHTEVYNVTQIIDRNKIVKEGYIYKRGSRDKWRRVYAFIEDNILFYTKDQANKYKSKGLRLRHVKTVIKNVEALENIRKYYIKLIDTDEKEHHLSYESKEDMFEWVKLIKLLSGSVDPTK